MPALIASPVRKVPLGERRSFLAFSSADVFVFPMFSSMDKHTCTCCYLLVILSEMIR